MKHIAWHFSGFQTRSNTYIFEMETVRGGGGLGGRRRERTKKFDTRRILVDMRYQDFNTPKYLVFWGLFNNLFLDKLQSRPAVTEQVVAANACCWASMSFYTETLAA